MENETHTSQNIPLETRIGGFLFAFVEPVSVAKLASFFSVSSQEVEEALDALNDSLGTTGIVLVRNVDSVQLVTTPRISSDLEKFFKKEQTGDLGNAALETLSIILYSGPIAKREIDFIRGVNSGYIVRNLMLRGLIEKGKEQTGERSTVYQATFDLLNHLGVQNVEDLPEYEKVAEELKEVTSSIEDNE